MSDILRPAPPFVADEKPMLSAFLDYQRATLLRKVAGLDADAFVATPARSALTLGGIVKHLAAVEHGWFQFVFMGAERGEPWASAARSDDPEWVWTSAPADDPDALRTLLETEHAAARRVAADHDLDEVSARPNWKGERCSLRWIVLHMIQEYARHNGHADLLREALDGSTGL
jgi:uncharacterized damage-inducible protein DinB